jgi:hypothetical protein
MFLIFQSICFTFKKWLLNFFNDDLFVLCITSNVLLCCCERKGRSHAVVNLRFHFRILAPLYLVSSFGRMTETAYCTLVSSPYQHINAQLKEARRSRLSRGVSVRVSLLIFLCL